MKKHIGNLEITNANLEEYKDLSEVSGYVDIRADNASLPALTEVSGSVYIRADNASLPALTKSGYVYIRADNASLPALTEVSGYVDIRADNAGLPALLETITAVEGGFEFQWGDHKLSAKCVYVRSTVETEYILVAELSSKLKYHAGCFHGSYREAVKRIGGRTDYTDALNQLRETLKGWKLQ